MVGYKLYANNGSNGPDLVGILPERRKDPTRITQESVMNWGRMLTGDDAGFNELFFAQVIIDDDTGRIIKAPIN
jgi:hypothetical protein